MKPLTVIYEQFIKQPNWEDILYHNYVTGQPPLSPLDQTLNTINNDTDRFDLAEAPSIYLSELSGVAHHHLTKILILKTRSPYYTYYYTLYVIRDRWPEGEEIIKQDQRYAYAYARDVIKGRWIEIEGMISQDPWYAYVYAKNIIKGRWPEAEGTIEADRYWWPSYLRIL